MRRLGDYQRPPINHDDVERRKNETVHHIYPRSRGGTNDSNNKVRLYEPLHNGLHAVFGNGTPREQILQLLTINKTALNREFVRDLQHILNEDDDQYYYHNGVYIRH